MSLTGTRKQHEPMLCPYRVGDIHVTAERTYTDKDGNKIGITGPNTHKADVHKARTLNQTGEYTPGQKHVETSTSKRTS